MDLHPDLTDLLAAFAAAGAEYLVVGGYAVAAHGRPRFTKDLDVWIGEDPANLERVATALVQFGAPASAVEELRRSGPEDIVWLGAAPVRVEIVRRLPGVQFASAQTRRMSVAWGGVTAHVIGFDDLIASKTASGRGRDLADVRALRRRRAPRP
ncbi:MAG: hypothetical protein KBD01_13840 [Acidobacteria bacterium]|nr:hypothetical protein [Acidobacteriota bacterium]